MNGFVCVLKAIELYQFLLTSEKQVYTVFADSAKRELDYTNLRRKHSLSVSYILCGIVGVVETQMQLIF